MRGSPLLQFTILTLLLAASGLGLVCVTSPASKDSSAPQLATVVTPTSTVSLTPYHLQLSAPASSVEIDTGHLVRPSNEVLPLSGSLEIDVKNPRVAVIVRWKNPAAPGEHRFAKLTLEAPGQETLTHLFDADGDIDDLWELPFPTAR